MVLYEQHAHLGTNASIEPAVLEYVLTASKMAADVCHLSPLACGLPYYHGRETMFKNYFEHCTPEPLRDLQ